MKFKSLLIKVLMALALVAPVAVSSQAPAAQAAKVKAVNKQVVVNYVSGYSVKAWKNCKVKLGAANDTGISFKHGTTLTVVGEVKYKKQTWYKIADNEWILASYTLSPKAWAKKAAAAKRAAAKAAKKAAAAKKLSKSKKNKQNKVVALAKAQVGKPYVWGATGPYSFDCSGLTSYVYSHALGKYITRTTYTQVHQGKTVAVSTATLKKGDLLFWGSKSSPYHVGIYVGGGKFVHAATPSQGVIKQSLSYYFWPSTAKRLI